MHHLALKDRFKFFHIAHMPICAMKQVLLAVFISPVNTGRKEIPSESNFNVGDGGQDPRLSETNVSLQQSELDKSEGSLPHLQSFLVSCLPGQHFLAELQWRDSGTKGEICAKKTATLKDIHLICPTQTNECSY